MTTQPPQPASLAGWKRRIRWYSKTNEQVAVLLDCAASETGERYEGGLAVQLLKQARDPEYAVSLLWKALERAQGNPFRYAIRVANGGAYMRQSLQQKYNMDKGGTTAEEWFEKHGLPERLSGD